VIDPATDKGVSAGIASDSARLAALAPALGALLAGVQQTVPSIDLLNPRQPPPKRDERKRRMVLGGSAAATLALLLGAAAWSYSSGLDEKIAQLQQRDVELTESLKRGKPTVAAHNLVHGWLADAVDPLAGMDRLNRLLPGADRVLLLSLNVTNGRGEAVATLTGTGIARTERDIFDLFQTLSDNGYRVAPQVIDSDSPDPDYPLRFDLKADRLAPAPAPAAAGPKPQGASGK
jgi:hypothetical protein